MLLPIPPVLAYENYNLPVADTIDELAVQSVTPQVAQRELTDFGPASIIELSPEALEYLQGDIYPFSF